MLPMASAARPARAATRHGRRIAPRRSSRRPGVRHPALFVAARR